ncbi:MAG TPA: HAMP domain-containing sensor histidine kinase [Roseiflexaceae bacterium]|nr:HAMP domain-containing sensor histidine kinase [Roseiflexaceae bacterium]
MSPRINLFRTLAGLFVLLGPATLLLSQFVPALNQPAFNNMLSHVLAAGSCALVGLGLAWLVLVIARRTADRRALLIGLALLANALLFSLHTVSTPGFLFANTGTTPNISSQLSLNVGAFFFLASSLTLSPRLDRAVARHAGLWIGLVWLGCAVCAWQLLAPAATAAALPATSGHVHDAAPLPASQPFSRFALDSIFVLSALCYLVATWRYLRINRQSPSAFGTALIYGVMLFCSATVIQRLGGLFTAMFWAYHAQELAGFLVLGAAVFTSYQQGLAGAGVVESLLLPNTRARIEANYSSALDELIATLARGERPTGPLRATLHQRFGLPESQLQALERAAEAVTVERRQRQELEQLTARLQQLQGDKETLLQLVVHDLKNPLTALLGFLEMLRRETLTADQLELAVSALRSAKNLQELIDDLLDVARMEESKLDLHYTTASLTILLADVASEMHAWARQDDHILHVDVPHDILVDVDERLMRRVLRNLLSNALKHTPGGTVVTLRARMFNEETGWCRIEVADDGPGIDEATRSRLFERFGRSHDGAPRRQQSTGLGLFFCRLAIEAHGGQIGVESVYGSGTTFWVRLPRSHMAGTLPESLLQPASDVVAAS